MKNALAVLTFVLGVSGPQISSASDRIAEAARAVEIQLDARVGLAIYDTGRGESWLYNADELFPMASTFKVLAWAALLSRVDAGKENTGRLIDITQADLVTSSPVTEVWVGEAVSLDALGEATLRTSDNAAANKVLDALGDPQALTAFMRSLGDGTTRLDRREILLNQTERAGA